MRTLRKYTTQAQFGGIVLKFNIAGSNPVINTADFKYNKEVAMGIGFDDALIAHYTHVYPVFKGGVSGLNGQTYPGLKYSDGTGKMIGFNGTLVLPANGVRLIDNESNAASLSWTKVKTLVDAGFGINNHSLNHGGGPTPWNRLNEIKGAEQLFYDKANYRTLIGTAPASEEGFLYSFRNLGYVAHNSTFNEGNSDITVYGKMRPAEVPTDFRTLDRWYPGDNFDASTVQSAKNYIDEIYNYCDTGKGFGNFFTHGPSVASGFDDVFNYLQNHPKNTSQNRLWVPSIQEFYEYFMVKRTSIIQTSVASGVLTVTIDQSGVPTNVRDRSMSMLLTGVSLTNLISASGVDEVTINPSTGLINVYKLKTTGFTNPGSDILPAQLLSVKIQSDTTKVKLTFDKNVTQSMLAGYSINGKTSVSLTGANTEWILSVNSSITTSNTLTNKSKNGNAVTDNGLKVCDYIGFPIT